MTDFKKQTAWHFVPGTDKREVFRIIYGFTAFKGNAGPYFGVTHERYGSKRGKCEPSKREVGFGTVSHEMIDWLPEAEQKALRTANAFHLFEPSTGPMHYEANALYFLKMAFGETNETWSVPDPWRAFLRHIAYGLIPEDTQTTSALREDMSDLSEAERMLWLRDRLPQLQLKFRSVVTELGLEKELADARMFFVAEAQAAL